MTCLLIEQQLNSANVNGPMFIEQITYLVILKQMTFTADGICNNR